MCPWRVLKALLGLNECVISRATTFDNAANLAKPFIDEIANRYKGTRLGLQELDGELLEDVEGALWTRDMIEAASTFSESFASVIIRVQS
jgi:phage terminase large subunit-like protein